MKVVLAGGSGQIGNLLGREYVRRGWEVVILSRRAAASAQDRTQPTRLHWDGRNLGPWTQAIEQTDLVVNLAGRSVDCRYTQSNRKQIVDSRVESTAAIVRAINQAADPPRLLLQAGTATIYSHRHDAPNDDVTGILGGQEPGVPDTWRFSIEVAKAWEQSVETLCRSHTRCVILRSAMTMSPDPGGVFDVLLRLVRLGLGGRQGDGRQYVSWIHDVDFIAAIDQLIQQESIEGAVNLCSPHPVPNHTFMRTLRQSWGCSWGLPANRWMLELGALALRTETELILKSRRVVPTRLLQSGFQFQFPEWKPAADDLCRRFREKHHGS